jgi:hypothetical protein
MPRQRNLWIAAAVERRRKSSARTAGYRPHPEPPTPRPNPVPQELKPQSPSLINNIPPIGFRLHPTTMLRSKKRSQCPPNNSPPSAPTPNAPPAPKPAKPRPPYMPASTASTPTASRSPSSKIRTNLDLRTDVVAFYRPPKLPGHGRRRAHRPRPVAIAARRARQPVFPSPPSTPVPPTLSAPKASQLKKISKRTHFRPRRRARPSVLRKPPARSNRTPSKQKRKTNPISPELQETKPLPPPTNEPNFEPADPHPHIPESIPQHHTSHSR